MREQIASYKDLAKQKFGRDIKIWCYGYVVQKDTQEEADAYGLLRQPVGDDEGCDIITGELGIQTGIFTPKTPCVSVSTSKPDSPGCHW